MKELSPRLAQTDFVGQLPLGLQKKVSALLRNVKGVKLSDLGVTDD